MGAILVLHNDPGLLPRSEKSGPPLLGLHLPVRLGLGREGGHLHSAGVKPEIPEAGDALRLSQEGETGPLHIIEKSLGGKGGGLPVIGPTPVRQGLLDTIQQVHLADGVLPHQVAVGLTAAMVEPQRVGEAVPVQVGGVGGLGAVGQQPGNALLIEHVVVPGGVGGAPGGLNDKAALAQQGGEVLHTVAIGVGAVLHGEAEQLVPLSDGPVFGGVAAWLPVAHHLLAFHELRLRQHLTHGVGGDGVRGPGGGGDIGLQVGEREGEGQCAVPRRFGLDRLRCDRTGKLFRGTDGQTADGEGEEQSQYQWGGPTTPSRGQQIPEPGPEQSLPSVKLGGKPGVRGAHKEPSFRSQYRVNTALEVSHARVSL